MTAAEETYSPDKLGDEEQLLGSILAGFSPADVAKLGIGPEDFWQPRNEYVYRACLAVADEGKRCDPQTVMFQMGKWAHRLPGGPIWLVEISQYAIPANAAAYAERIKSASRRRALQAVARRILQQAEDCEDPDALLEDARSWLDMPSIVQPSSAMIGDLLPGYIDRVERGGDKGLPTPWDELDRHLNGLQPGRLYTFGARPGVGKSVMLLNLATHWAGKHNLGVYFASLEMPAYELVGRVVASNAHITQSALVSGDMTEMDWARLARAQERIAVMPLRICDDSGQTLRSIRAGALEMKRRGTLGLVCVDYIQLVDPTDKRLSRQQQIGEISRGLKKLAKELGVPVVTASQLRRSSGGHARPGMDDLRESGDIEADSDVVVLLHLPDPDLPWDMELVIAKNRNGSKGQVSLMFDGERATMQNHGRITQ